jgi:excisionase family DNA binding protein
MKAAGNQRSERRAATVRALRSVLVATAGNAKVLELYRVLSAEQTAEWLGLALQTVRKMTARHELPCIKIGKRGVGYRVIDLIEWQESRRVPLAG